MNSAILNIEDETPIPINENHQNLVRFPHRDHAALNVILGCIRTCLGTTARASYEKKQQILLDWLGQKSLEGEGVCYFSDTSAPGTCDWVTLEPALQAWVEDRSKFPHLLWIQGLQGTGKSMMAPFIANFISEKHKKPESKPCIYAFKEQSNSDQPLIPLLGSLAFQLGLRSKKFRNHLVKAIQNGHSLAGPSELSLWESIFLNELTGFNADYKDKIFWIVDGLDTCASSDVWIRGLNHLSKTTVPLRILILSRWTRGIEDEFKRLAWKKGIINLNKAPAAKETLSKFISTNLGSSGRETREIMDWAQENFQTASLFIDRALKTSESKRAEILTTIPPGDILGAVIRASVREWTQAELRANQCILLFVAYAENPLKVDQVSEILSLSGINGYNMKDITKRCGHLMVVENTYLRVRHKTVVSFLEEKTVQGLYLGPDIGHQKLLELCLTALLKLDMASPVSNYRRGSFQEYALTSWFFHLNKAPLTDTTTPLLEEFLNGRYIESWISQVAELKMLDLAISASVQFILLRSKIPTALQEGKLCGLLQSWSEELPQIIGHFRGPLLEHPQAIFGIIPAFCPSSSILRMTPQEYGPDTIDVRGVKEQQWNDTLAKFLIPRSSSMITRSSAFLAVASSRTNEVAIFSTSTFTRIQTYNHNGVIQKIQFSTCGTILAVYGYETLKVIKINKGQPWSFTVPPLTQLLDLTFTQDDKCILVCTDCGKVIKYPLNEDTAQGTVIGSVRHTDDDKLHGVLSSAAFAFNKKKSLRIATSCSDLPVSVWEIDLDASMPISRPFRLVNNRVPESHQRSRAIQLEWIPASTFVLVVNHDGSAWAWDTTDGTKKPIGDSRLGTTSLKASPGGLFVVSRDRTSLKVWNTESFSLVCSKEFSGQTLDYAICAQNRTVIRLGQAASESFCEIWGPNCLAQFSITKVWNTRDLQKTSQKPNPDIRHQRVQELAVGGHSLVHCSAHRQGGLTIFGANGRTSHTISPPSFRVIRAMAWSKNEKTLAVADDMKCLYLYNVTTTGASLHVSEVVSIEVRDTPQRLLFNGDGTSLLGIGKGSISVWCYKDNMLQLSHQAEYKDDSYWATYSTDDVDFLLRFRPGSVSIVQWRNLEVAVVLPLVLASSSQSAGILDESPPHGWVTNAKISGNKSQILIQVSTKTDIFDLLLIQTLDLMSSLDGQVTELKAVKYSPAIIDLIYLPFGLLASSNGRTRQSQQTDSVLVFLDKKGWLCTVDLMGRLREHYFLPHDWLDPFHLKLAMVTEDGTLFIPRREKVGIILNGFRQVIKESCLNITETALPARDHLTSSSSTLPCYDKGYNRQ